MDAFSLTSGFISLNWKESWRLDGGYGYAPNPQFPAPLVNVFISLHHFPSCLHIHTLYTALRFGLEWCPFGKMGCPFSPFYVGCFFLL